MVKEATSVIKVLHREWSSRDRSPEWTFELHEGLLYMILLFQLIQIMVSTEKFQ